MPAKIKTATKKHGKYKSLVEVLLEIDKTSELERLASRIHREREKTWLAGVAQRGVVRVY